MSLKFKKEIQKYINEQCNCDEPSDINEMARIATLYDINDSEENLSKLPEKIRNGRTLKGIIEYIKEKGPSAVANIAKEKFGKPQQAINSLIKILTDAGVLVSQGLEKEPEYLKPKEPKKLGRPFRPKEPDATLDMTLGDDVDVFGIGDDVNNSENTEDIPVDSNIEINQDNIEFEPKINKKSPKYSADEDELISLEKEMKDKAKAWKNAEGDEKVKLKDELKTLTSRKKELEKTLADPEDDSVNEEINLMEGYNRFQKLANIKILK